MNKRNISPSNKTIVVSCLKCQYFEQCKIKKQLEYMNYNIKTEDNNETYRNNRKRN